MLLGFGLNPSRHAQTKKVVCLELNRASDVVFALSAKKNGAEKEFMGLGEGDTSELASNERRIGTVEWIH
jgi:hypothetical protein